MVDVWWHQAWFETYKWLKKHQNKAKGFWLQCCKLSTRECWCREHTLCRLRQVCVQSWGRSCNLGLLCPLRLFHCVFIAANQMLHNLGKLATILKSWKDWTLDNVWWWWWLMSGAAQEHRIVAGIGRDHETDIFSFFLNLHKNRVPISVFSKIWRVECRKLLLHFLHDLEVVGRWRLDCCIRHTTRDCGHWSIWSDYDDQSPQNRCTCV